MGALSEGALPAQEPEVVAPPNPLPNQRILPYRYHACREYMFEPPSRPQLLAFLVSCRHSPLSGRTDRLSASGVFEVLETIVGVGALFACGFRGDKLEMSCLHRTGALNVVLVCDSRTRPA